MKEDLTPDSVGEYLFSQGMTLAHYWIERTAISEVICYKNVEGRDFDMLIADDRSAHVIKQRLLALGVRIVEADRGDLSNGKAKP